MRFTIPSHILGSACALALFFATGCSDEVAQKSAADARKEVAELKNQVTALATQNEKLTKDIADLKTTLSEQMTKRLDGVNEQIAQAKQEMGDRLSKENQHVHKAAEVLRDVGAQMEAAQKNLVAKSEMAQAIQGLRSEITQHEEDLKRFMDNQLRELYPYAYQPRRLDANTPPPAEEPRKEKPAEGQN